MKKFWISKEKVMRGRIDCIYRIYYRGMRQKLVGPSCFVDLKKAFDTINDDVLFGKIGKIRL